MTPWDTRSLRDALDVEAASDDASAAPLARWLDQHPDGVVTAEDFVSRPAGLPPLER